MKQTVNESVLDIKTEYRLYVEEAMLFTFSVSGLKFPNKRRNTAHYSSEHNLTPRTPPFTLLQSTAQASCVTRTQIRHMNIKLMQKN
ncbi:hypothetical protein HMPREF9370_2011 [Neisseria wadsworthii 9715]|uniref:Uncharacterized protein n=1 Tax=Neisseria wadsworthii 9715 TaxID=1030841 RepID=G4CSF1_9NEIS|nr:hypothetical protein HMPREF9370_2011 [Neisseria wadsworthii 9715]